MYDFVERIYTGENVSTEIFDLDLAFSPHPISHDIRKKSGIEAIKQSVRVLCILNHYEKPFHPQIGSDILKSMFEPIHDMTTRNIMAKDIKKMIELYEPRATNINVQINAIEDENALSITVFFTPEQEIRQVSVDIFLRILR